MRREDEQSLAYIDGRMYLDGEPFTGIGYFLDDDGNLETETSYREGIQMGLRRAWYETGQLQHEYSMFRGVFHGKKRDWHFNGQLAEESEYELGFAMERKRWDEDGNLIEEFVREPDDPAYEQLERDRAIYKDELEEEARRADET